MVLGSEATGEFVSGSMQINPPVLHFEASPQSVKKEYKNWQIGVNLAFMVDLTSQNIPPSSLSPNQYLLWITKEWHNIETSILITSFILIGSRLAPIIMRLALDTLILAVI